MDDIVAFASGGQAALSLAEHAAEIRRRAKRLLSDVVEIGRLLTECQKIVGHGSWLAWLDRELGWSQSTALNCMRAFQLAQSKNANFADLNLPLSALYLLAAPSTPPEVQDQIIERAVAGEVTKVTDVKKAIGARKRPVQTDNSATEHSTESELINTATTGAPKIAPAVEKSNDTRVVRRASSHLEILEAWDNAPPEERIKAVNSIGLEPLFAALPQNWMPEIEKRLTAWHQASAPAPHIDPTCAIPADLSIPLHLRRGPPGSSSRVGAGHTKLGHHDETHQR
jgi:hypothetical protein